MIDTVLGEPELRVLLCAEQRVAFVALLYADLKKFENCEHVPFTSCRLTRVGSIPISHAHIIYQKYLAPDAPCRVEVTTLPFLVLSDLLQIPRIKASMIHSLLWKDEDGADSQGLVTTEFYTDVKKVALRMLREEYKRQRSHPIFSAVMERMNKTKDTANKRSLKSKSKKKVRTRSTAHVLE